MLKSGGGFRAQVTIVALLATRYVQGLEETEGWVQYWVDFAEPFRTPGFFVIAGLQDYF